MPRAVLKKAEDVATVFAPGDAWKEKAIERSCCSLP